MKPAQLNIDYEIYWHSYDVVDPFSGQTINFEGWTHTNHTNAVKGECNPVGIFDSYVSAMADAMGLWEDYCEVHRTRVF